MLNCHKLNGDFTKPITVDTNDPEHPHVTLTCKGKIMEAVKITPTLVNLGRVAIGQKNVQRTIKLLRGDAGPIKPELIRVTNDSIKAEIREVKPGEEYHLVVSADPNPSELRIQGKVELRTGVPEQEVTNINVFGSVIPRVSARPPVVVVPSDANTNWFQNVELDWPADTGGFKLIDASVNHPSLTASVDEKSAKPRVRVTLEKPIQGNLPASTIVTVKTDDPKSPQVTFPVRYRRAPPVGTRPGVRRPAVRPQTPRRAAPQRSPAKAIRGQRPAAAKATPENQDARKAKPPAPK
ncbi:MAG TPA: hypothetical protein P5572_08375 [Phycisphaerae bacterium]|nr:hypothetical protein [Phycisphaerae bacterium]